MRNIIICGTQRCGSTMVCEDMTNTGQLGYPEERMGQWRYSVETDWAAELEKVRALGTTPNGVFSIKLMAGQIVRIEQCLATIVPPSTAPVLPHLMAAFPNATWVWVRRRDTLLQVISNFVASATGKYHLIEKNNTFMPGKATSVRPDTLPYDYKAIMRHWAALQAYSLKWAEFFDANGIKPLTIWYEDAAHTPATQQIAEAAGVSLTGQAVPRKLKKMADGRSDELRRRLVADLFKQV